MRIQTAAALMALLALAPAARAELSLTVYSEADPAGFDPQKFIAQQRQGQDPNYVWQVPGFGVVRDEREMTFKEGRNVVGLTDVAAFIDPTTVSFVDQADAAASAVIEQQFLFDLVSPQKMLEKYVDQTVTVRVSIGEGKAEDVTGTLLSANQGQLVVQTKDGVRLIGRGDAQVMLGKVPGGLITRPTLQWILQAKAAGKRTIRTTYQTAGITWKADYNLLLNGDDTKADLAAWVTLMNLSGTTYPNTNLKLIAGDVQRVQPQQQFMQPMIARGMAQADAQNGAGFQEKSFFEYHLYTLPRKTDVAQNTTQQIALFPTVSGVGVEKVLLYDGAAQAAGWHFGAPMMQRQLGVQSGKKVDVFLRIKNTEANALGLPLPRGKVRVYKQDPADKSLEFIGEDLIDHTSKNETLLVKTGQSFDVTGQRTQTDFQVNEAGHVIVESFKIELSNAKKAPQKLVVQEHLYRWTNWTIEKKSDEFTKKDARTIHFEVELPAEGKKTVEYTVKYTW
jgi:hypothetical protein